MQSFAFFYCAQEAGFFYYLLAGVLGPETGGLGSWAKGRRLGSWSEALGGQSSKSGRGSGRGGGRESRRKS